MKFEPRSAGAVDIVGGLPSHLPEEFPLCEHTKSPMAFVAQFACNERVPIPGAHLVQVYQCLDGAPWPQLVLLDADAPPNANSEGILQPALNPVEVKWIAEEEPLEPNDWEGLDHLSPQLEGLLQSSKAGGFAYDGVEEGESFILQMREPEPTRRVFGGFTLQIVVNSNGHPEARLA